MIIFSAVSDKKYEQMIKILCRQVKAKTYIVTEIEDRRRVPSEELKYIFEKYTDAEVLERQSLKDALDTAYARRGEGEIYCLGSLYLVGMVKKIIAGGSDHA